MQANDDSRLEILADPALTSRVSGRYVHYVLVSEEGSKTPDDFVVQTSSEVDTDASDGHRAAKQDRIPVSINVRVGDDQISATDDDGVLCLDGLAVVLSLTGAVQNGQLVSFERTSMHFDFMDPTRVTIFS